MTHLDNQMIFFTWSLRWAFNEKKKNGMHFLTLIWVGGGNFTLPVGFPLITQKQ